MKKLLILLSIVLLAFSANSQTYTPRGLGLGYYDNAIKVPFAFAGPSGTDTTFNGRPNFNGSTFFQNADHRFYVYDSLNNMWRGIAWNSGSGQNLNQVLHVGNVGDSSIYIRDSVNSNFLQADTALFQNSLTSANALIGPGVPFATHSAYFYGTSITEGYNSTNHSTDDFVARYGDFTNTNVVNFGQSSTTLVELSAGDSSFQDRLYSVLSFSNDKIFLEYGTNDVFFSVPIDTFVVVYKRMIDSLHLDRGFPLDSIVLITPTYRGTVGSINAAVQEVWADSVVSVAKAKGTAYVDMFHYMENNGSVNLLSSDSVHPNDLGHEVIAQGLAFYQSGGAAVINGPLFVHKIVSQTQLNVESARTAFNGIIADSAKDVNDTAVTEISNFTAFPGQGDTWIKTNGPGGSWVTSSPKWGVGTAGFKTATQSAINGGYLPGNYGMQLYTDQSGNNFFTTYSYAGPGTNLQFPGNSGPNILKIDYANSQTELGGSGPNAGYTLSIAGSTIIGNGSQGSWLHIMYPNNTFANTGNFYTLAIEADGTLIDSPPCYAPGGVADTAAGAPVDTKARNVVNAIGTDHTVFSPTTGGTVTPVLLQNNIIIPTGSFTLALPGSPTNGEYFFVTVTASATVSTSGGTFVGTISQGYQKIQYDSGTSTWY